MPHRRLISKLKSYGVCPEVVKWINDFLDNRFHCVRVNGKLSDIRSVPSGIPQGSILGPLLFVIYINDLPQLCGDLGELYLFADDAKLFRTVKVPQDIEDLQLALNKLSEWSDTWLLRLNVKKCVFLPIGPFSDSFDHEYYIRQDDQCIRLDKASSTRDLGVEVDAELKFTSHIQTKVNKANSMLGLIHRNFNEMDIRTFIMLYKSLVRSHLDYASSIWSPYRKTLIKDIEKIQKRATKMIRQLKHLNYEDRLRHLQLPTLVYRRHRGDMIEVYKIISGLYSRDLAPPLSLITGTATRGNSFKLTTQRSKYDIRKYSFTPRVASVWNSLPDEVIRAGTVNAFKNRLDSFWSGQECRYNYQAKLTGIGIRGLDV